MKTQQREIVGAFIFSSDGLVLLGYNKKGGVNQGLLTIPGGGIEPGESYIETMKREILEETGLDVSKAKIAEIPKVSSGESERIDPVTGEIILMQMNFHDFVVELGIQANDTRLVFLDDFETASWYTPEDLREATLAPAVRETLKSLHFLQ